MSDDHAVARTSFSMRWLAAADGIYLSREDVARLLLDVAEAVVDLDEVSASVLAQLVDDFERIGPRVRTPEHRPEELRWRDV